MPGITINVTISEFLNSATELETVLGANSVAQSELEAQDGDLLHRHLFPLIESLGGLQCIAEMNRANHVQATEKMTLGADMLFGRPIFHSIEEVVDITVSMAMPKGIFSLEAESLAHAEDLDGHEDVEDPEEEIWDCWVLNTQELHPSVYSGFDFNSYAEFRNITYAASREGIFSITYDHNEQFQPGVILPATSLGLTNAKRFRAGYIGFSGGKPSVKVKADNGAEVVLKVVRNKFVVPRNQVGRRWQFTLAEFESLEFVEIYPIILTKSRQPWQT